MSKTLLRKVYLNFYREIAQRLRSNGGLTVELGSGLGVIKQVIRDCLTSDQYSTTWLDREENAYKLSLADDSVMNLILFDVWHHLEFPGTALNEFERVLRPNGRLILFEPDMGLLGRGIYSLLHHEPVAMHEPIQWFAPPGFQPNHASGFSAQSRANRIFVRGEFSEMFGSWRVVEVRRFASLAYLFSGGYSKPALLPGFLFRALDLVDRVLSVFPALFSVRVMAVLEKQ